MTSVATPISVRMAEARTLSIQEAGRLTRAARSLASDAAVAGGLSAMPAGVRQELDQLARSLETGANRLSVLLQRVAA